MSKSVSSSENKGPSTGTRIAHVGIAVRDLEEILPFYRDDLGLPEVQLDDADGARITGLQAGESLIEFLEDESAASPISRFVERSRPGIHKICLTVDELEANTGRCWARGIRLIDEVARMGAEGKRFAFLHPSSTAGVIVEL